MNVGMLWWCDVMDKNMDAAVKLAANLRQASDYYKNKYGMTPDRCFVNIAALSAASELGGIRVRPVTWILPNHLWMGVEDKTNGKTIQTA